jgi:uncharacterized protein (DUF488 family)
MIQPAPPQASVFTLGYQLRSIDEYVRELQDADVGMVVDVREVAWSHKRFFSKTKLRTFLGNHGIGYVHLPFAGNPKELRRSARSHADCLKEYDRLLASSPELVDRFAEHLSEWLEDGLRPCLLCYERHPADCHRTRLLERAVQRIDGPVVVQHLGVMGAPRLS